MAVCLRLWFDYEVLYADALAQDTMETQSCYTVYRKSGDKLGGCMELDG